MRPVPRPRHRNVEQAVILLALRALPIALARVKRCKLRVTFGRPYEMIDISGRCDLSRQVIEPWPLIARSRARVGQEYDRRLQAFGAVHRHDADLVALLFHVALDLDVTGAKLVEEALQRGRGIAVEGERAVEELIDRFGGFWPKSREHALAKALPIGIEQLGKKLVRRQEIRAPQKMRQLLPGRGKARIVLGFAF